MSVQVNGAIQTLPHGSSVAMLLESLRLAGQRVAVERNGEVVPRGLHAATTLQDGDRIELIRAVGGG
ncbi:MAG: sulfur carrier protein ThiS [Acidithiobacillus sp.]|nr:sulfur carrier protein ThiS [Candidatus Igneacidithiobacillus taiwanensis]MCE5360410.1 sulfur carrier protein ThiS [Acidithiobacillus sp.]